jgi:hypothetical protein
MSGGPIAIRWSHHTLVRAGWVDVELVDLTPFCCHACQADWLAAHRNALGPHQDRPAVGWRMVGQPDRRLGEADYDVWCAAYGVLIQVGLEEPPCSAGACPLVVINRLPSARGERCPACGRWQQIPASLLAMELCRD